MKFPPRLSSWLTPLVLVLLTATGAAATVDTAALIEAAPGLEAYPDADAVVLHRSVTLTLAPDGSLTRREHTVTRLQTQWAMRRLSDTRVAWDSTRQDLVVHTCRTFMSDGKVVPSPDNAFNEVTPRAVDRAVPFLDIREMVISHVGTDLGCVLDLDYEIRDREPGPLPAWAEVFFPDRWPVREVTVRLDPQDVLAGMGPADHGLVNEEILEPGERAWTFRDLAAWPTEGADRNRGDFTPHLMLGAARSWDAVAAALREYRDRAAVTGPALNAWLGEVQSGDDGALTRLETVERIAAVAHDGVRTINLPTGLWSRAPRTAEEVFTSAVATPWEQALLAYALLEAAGLEPEIGFFSRWRSPNTNIPAVGHFGDLRVVVPVDGRNWWLAPGRDEPWPGRCDLAGRWGLFLDRSGGHRTYTASDREGFCRLNARIAPDEAGDSLVATADLLLRGQLAENAGSADDLTAALAGRLLLDGEIQEVTTRADTPEEIHLRFTATGTALAERDDRVTVYAFPYPAGAVLAHLPRGFDAAAPERSAPLFIETKLREEFTLELVLPDGMIPDALPAAQSLAAGLGSYTMEVERTAGTVRIDRTVELRPGRCDPAQYPALRTVLLKALQQEQAPAVFTVE